MGTSIREVGITHLPDQLIVAKVGKTLNIDSITIPIIITIHTPLPLLHQSRTIAGSPSPPPLKDLDQKTNHTKVIIPPLFPLDSINPNIELRGMKRRMKSSQRTKRSTPPPPLNLCMVHTSLGPASRKSFLPFPSLLDSPSFTTPTPGNMTDC
jgi:hypothetical protein